jgi:hypothetical protein
VRTNPAGCSVTLQREPPGWASLDLDLAGDRLEMPNLISRHGTDMGTVQSDDDLTLGRLLPRGCSRGVGGLELPSDGVEPIADADVAGW